MVKLLITTLTEVLQNCRDYASGNIEDDLLQESYKRFSQAFDAYIDYRIEQFYENRRRKTGQDRITMADSINSTIKSTAASVRSMSALSAAPTPPPFDLVKDKEAMENWAKNYDDWYKTQRENGLNIK